MNAAPDLLFRQVGEEALDMVEPRGGRWGEVNMPARSAAEPGANDPSASPTCDRSNKRVLSWVEFHACVRAIDDLMSVAMDRWAKERYAYWLFHGCFCLVEYRAWTLIKGRNTIAF